MNARGDGNRVRTGENKIPKIQYKTADTVNYICIVFRV